MEKGVVIINENLSETIEYNSPTTPIKAAHAYLSEFPNGITPCHWHKELELIVVFEGAMSYVVHDTHYRLHAGQGIIVNSNRLHLCGPLDHPTGNSANGFHIAPEEDCHYAVLLLHPDTLRFNVKMEERYINPLVYDLNSNAVYLSLEESWHAEAIRTILSIFHTVTEQVPCFELLAQSQFFYLWSLLYQNTIAKNGCERIETDPLNPLKTMISYIQDHYQDKVTLNDIAESGMMCQSKCCRLFRETLRQSPIEYLQSYRIQRGIDLLNHSSMSITEIALECGFHGASYFTETFRKLNGITPKEYRKQTLAGA